jgi:hypothetical protein
MRKVMLVALFAATCGCAHRQPRNLAQRQSAKTPRGDFDGSRRHAPRELGRGTPPVTPRVP